MNKKEAINIIDKELANYRSKSYLELKEMIGDEPVVKEIKSESDQKYQLEITALWDNESKGNIRIIGSIDDSGWRSLIPLTKDFILSPEGDFIDE